MAKTGQFVDEILIANFGRLDKVALGLSVGIVAGSLLFVSTAILVLRGGETVGPHLSLLGQYIPGYSVTWYGSLVGLVAGALLGFAGGWTVAFLRNLGVTLYTHVNALIGHVNRYFDSI